MLERNPLRYRKAPKPETMAERGYVKPTPKSLIRKESRNKRVPPDSIFRSIEQMSTYMPSEFGYDTAELADIHSDYE